MRLTPITAKVTSQRAMLNKQPQISFGANDEQSKRDKSFKTYAACTAAAALLGGATVYKCAHDDLEKSRENINKIFDKYELQDNLYSVKRDTIIIDDVTGDNYPELILYKEDGSMVVMDIKDCKILNTPKK